MIFLNDRKCPIPFVTRKKNPELFPLADSLGEISKSFVILFTLNYKKQMSSQLLNQSTETIVLKVFPIKERCHFGSTHVVVIRERFVPGKRTALWHAPDPEARYKRQ